MDKETYLKWVEWFANNWKGVPKDIYDDYDNFISKVHMAFLISGIAQEEQAALDLYEQILEENLIAFDEEQGISYQEYIEAKIMTLENIGSLSYRLNDDLLKAYHYTEKALEIAEFVGYDFEMVVRGEVWVAKLKYLREIKGDQVVLDEIENRISHHKESCPLTANSYLYNAYRMLSDIEEEKRNKDLQLDYYKQALEYYPLDQDKKDKIEEIWAKGKAGLIDFPCLEMSQEIIRVVPEWKL